MTAIKSSETYPLIEKITSIVGASRGYDNPVIVLSYGKDACHLTTAKPGIIVIPFVLTCYL